MLPPFTPGVSANLTVTTSSARVQIPAGGSQVRIAANGTQNVFVKFGNSSVDATTGDMCVIANTVVLFTVSRPTVNSASGDAHTHVAAIAAATGTAINVTSGAGS